MIEHYVIEDYLTPEVEAEAAFPDTVRRTLTFRVSTGIYQIRFVQDYDGKQTYCLLCRLDIDGRWTTMVTRHPIADYGLNLPFAAYDAEACNDVDSELIEIAKDLERNILETKKSVLPS